MNSNSVSSVSGNTSNSKVELLARAGYIAKGVVYGTVGVLVLGELYGLFGEGKVTGTRGALETIASQPFGNALLILMTIGLAGYTLWRIVQAFKDTENKGDDASGWMQRTGFLLSGLTYGALAFYAAHLAGWLGGGGGGGGSKRQEWTAQLMRNDAGLWLIGIIGVILACVGLYQFYRAATRDFEKNWRGEGIGHGRSAFAVRFSQFGVAARGFTLVLIGWIIIAAAMNTNPGQAKGLGHALQSLRDEAYGTTLLTLIGAGLIGYGLYCFINARYRKIDS